MNPRTLTVGTINNPAHLFIIDQTNFYITINNSRLVQELKDEIQTKIVAGNQISCLKVQLVSPAKTKIKALCGEHLIIPPEIPLGGIFQMFYLDLGDIPIPNWSVLDLMITHMFGCMTFEAERHLMLQNINEKLDAHLNAVNQLIQITDSDAPNANCKLCEVCTTKLGGSITIEGLEESKN